MVSVEEISIVDVYDLASDIGKEFEQVIEAEGQNAVANLIAKVINILEMLETLVLAKETDSAQIADLSEKIAHLETEKLEKAEFKKKLDKEMESMEEQWQKETRELLQVISRLQVENHRLVKAQPSKELQQHHQSQPHHMPPLTPGREDETSNEDDFDKSTISKLKQKLNQQHTELKTRERELQERASEVSNLSMQVESLRSALSESRRRQKLYQDQIITLFEERAGFLTQLQNQQHKIVSLCKRLDIAEKENADSMEGSGDVSTKGDGSAKSSVEQEEGVVSDLQKELSAANQSSSLSSTAATNEVPNEETTPSNEELPVQGPLPYEPDDAPWKKQSESGIRRFFRKLFSDNDAIGIPRRSVSTLTRMAFSAGPHSDIPI